MTWTQAEFDALAAAYKLGATTVTYGDGTSATFRSRADMRILLNEAANSLGVGGTNVMIRQIRMVTDKGT